MMMKQTFDQFMTELRNLASTSEFGDLHDSLHESCIRAYMRTAQSSRWNQISQNQICSTEERVRDDTSGSNQHMLN